MAAHTKNNVVQESVEEVLPLDRELKVNSVIRDIYKLLVEEVLPLDRELKDQRRLPPTPT